MGVLGLDPRAPVAAHLRHAFAAPVLPSVPVMVRVLRHRLGDVAPRASAVVAVHGVSVKEKTDGRDGVRDPCGGGLLGATKGVPQFSPREPSVLLGVTKGVC